ncbi:spore photoproduct lyase family protein [Streptomyces venezuelae]|uniref:spore photoproduct lyase family protein n=1 Tax=Streptomyces venezuelae TaxID=54571 RepID=UPI00278C6168|nr:spore photoproduct lyase family protein [Streptomyces venezuelae]
MRQGSGDTGEQGDEADGLFTLGDLAAAAAPSGAADGRRFHDGPRARRLLDVTEIYAEPAAADSLRGRQIIARFPEARLVETDSHWRIPHLHGNEGNVERWVRVKRETLVLGERKSFGIRPNGRSADWIAPGLSNGCAMACAYCYVPRRKGFANPITVFTNVERVLGSLGRHIAGVGRKEKPNQCDPHAWVYDIGENGDCSVDDLISDNTADLIRAFRRWPTAKASFATKFVNPDLLRLDPQGRTRIRFSVMPPEDSRLLDIRTSPVPDRLAAAADFLDAGYEVHFNLSPVVIRPGWEQSWADLLRAMDDVLPQRVKDQAAAEIILLTHNADLHQVNLGWHPRAEDVLWREDIQQPKRSENGSWNVSYRTATKARAVDTLSRSIEEQAPWLRVRYAF